MRLPVPVRVLACGEGGLERGGEVEPEGGEGVGGVEGGVLRAEGDAEGVEVAR